MLRSLFKVTLLLNSRSNNGLFVPTPHFLLHFSSAATAFSAPFSTTAASLNTPDSTVDYLVNRLSLSPEAANVFTALKKSQATKALNGKADLVVALLREYGFTPTHISELVIKYPSILLAKSETTVRPKLDFLSKNGISGRDLVQILSKDPGIFERSLCNQIIPCIAFLRDFLGSTRDLVDLLMAKRGTWILRSFSGSIVMNAQCLRKYKVPDSNILKLMTKGTRTLSRDCNEFSELVKEIVEMGFNPKSLTFINGLYTLSSMKKEKWASKLEVFQSFGWTEDQLKVLFRKQPIFMQLSEDRIKKALELFLNKLGWTIDDISVYPTVLCLSIERRILPRAEVVNVLVSKGLLKSEVGRPYKMSEDKFLEKYVFQYLEHVPQLLEIYRDEMGYVTSKDGVYDRTS